MNDKTQEKNGIWGDDDEEEKEEVDEGDEKIDKTKNTLKTEKNTSIIFKDDLKVIRMIIHLNIRKQMKIQILKILMN